MRRRLALATVALAATLSFAPVVVVAQDGEDAMSPEEQMMMQKWQAYMTPGEPHAHMAWMVGTWDYTTRMWQQPGMPPQESTGTARFEAIMGGRYIAQHASGPFMGQTFNGMGLSGYDNMTKKYLSMWIDNMGTGIMMSEGTCEGKVCTYYGEAPDVMLGKYKRVKSVSREISDDEMALEMYDTGPDGKEWKNFEILYHRRK